MRDRPAPRSGTWWSPSRACLVVVVLALLPLTSCGGGDDSESAGRQSGDVLGFSASQFDSGKFCQVVEKAPLDDMADALISLATKGRYEGGGMVMSLAMEYVKQNCNKWMRRLLQGGQTISKILPSEVQLAGIPTYTSLFPSPTVSVLVSQLRNAGFKQVTADSITKLADQLCNDIKGIGLVRPADRLKLVLPGADLDQLKQIKQLSGLVLMRCSGLNSYQADGLLSSLTGYLVGNESFIVDILPPVVFAPTWTRSGPTSITVSWTAFDLSGIGSYELWIQSDGIWAQADIGPTQTSTLVTNVFTGNAYTFAVKATDKKDNQSGWAYMSPCLTCPPA